MTITDKFAESLRDLRKARGYSQPELALRCGWDSQSRISMYERAEREPSLEDIDKLARALGTSVCDLLNPNTGHGFKIAEQPAYYAGDNKFSPEVIELTADFIDKNMPYFFNEASTTVRIKAILALLEGLKDPGLSKAEPATIVRLLNMTG